MQSALEIILNEKGKIIGLRSNKAISVGQIKKNGLIPATVGIEVTDDT